MYNRIVYWAVFILVFTLHNCEEIIMNLTAWSTMYNLTLFDMNRALFITVAVLLTMASIITAIVLEYRKSPTSLRVLRVFCWMMLFNALSHVALSIYSASYMPGVVTAVVLLIPVYCWLLLNSTEHRRNKWKRIKHS